MTLRSYLRRFWPVRWLVWHFWARRRFEKVTGYTAERIIHAIDIAPQGRKP